MTMIENYTIASTIPKIYQNKINVKKPIHWIRLSFICNIEQIGIYQAQCRITFEGKENISCLR